MKAYSLLVLGCALTGFAIASSAGAHVEDRSKTDATEPRRTLTIQLPENPSDYFPVLSPPTSVTMRSGLVTLAPGKSVGRHATGEYEELVIPLEGEGEMDVTGRGKTHFRRGQVLYAPPATEHDVTNTGKAVLRYIYVVARVPKS